MLRKITSICVSAGSRFARQNYEKSKCCVLTRKIAPTYLFTCAPKVDLRAKNLKNQNALF